MKIINLNSNSLLLIDMKVLFSFFATGKTCVYKQPGNK